MNDEALRRVLETCPNIIYPMHRNRLMGFLWRRTHWKCFITGWQCNGKVFDKNTPDDEMMEPPKLVTFYRWKDVNPDEIKIR